MNILKNIIAFLILLAAVVSCEKDRDISYSFDYIPAPSNVTAVFDIAQDNSGMVTIIPAAEGATKFMVKFGDAAEETPTEYDLNEVITHTYTEGTYNVEITAVGITGLTTVFTQEINVTFKAPENLVVTIEEDNMNPSIISVSATADFATIMEIYFGYVEDEEPVTVLPGEAATHTYEEPGDYIIRVIAKSGGSATTEFSDTITISGANEPVNLPIDFESDTVNYAFEDFGNVTTEVIDNPDASGINTSARVAKLNKPENAETWGGTFLTLENPIDFSTNKLFKVKVWSPKTGITVKLKVENLTDGEIGAEVDALTTVDNQWEELSYDFSDIDTNNDYQKVVIFFDFNNAGDNSDYYFDDIRLVPASLPSTLMIEDFEGTAPTFTVFGNIADTEVLANPDQSGVNTTATVAKLTKSSGSETWAGTFFELESALDLENYSKIKVRTWSPKSGITVKLKLENDDVSSEFEVDMTTTTSNAWEELEYDFSEAPAADYVRVVIFFDFGNAGDDSEYYFDELELTN